MAAFLKTILCSALFFSATRAHGQSSTPTPTPTCNRQAVEGSFGLPLDPIPTYVPGGTITLTAMPSGVDDDDWPTTPTRFAWNSSYAGRFDGDETEQFVLPDPGPDNLWITCTVLGDGIRPECPSWFTQPSCFYEARRFDYTPSPTPITPTPSPTPGCSPYPYDCVANIVSPPHGDVDQPTTVVLEHTGKEFLGFETIGGVPVYVTHLGGNRYLAENLDYLTIYVWYFIGAYSPCDGSPVVCMSLFRTVAEEEPTITPSPTPTPAPPPGNAWILTMALPAGPEPTPTPVAAWVPFDGAIEEREPGNPLVPVRNNMVWNCGDVPMLGGGWYDSSNTE